MRNVDELGGHTEVDTQSRNAAESEGGGQIIADAQRASANLCAEIRAVHRKRLFMVKVKNANRNALAAFVRVNVFGFDPNAPEKEREKIRKKGAKLIKDLAAGKGSKQDTEDIGGLVHDVEAAVLPFESSIKWCDKELERLGKQLPVWDAWAKGVKGLGPKALSMIIGETGDLNLYPNPAKVWKRLGLAVMNGRRQGNPGKKASAEGWIAHGYSGKRRSISWQAADAFFKHQLSRIDEETGEFVREPGLYGKHYYRKKAEYMARVEAGETFDNGKPKTKAWADKAARRYAEKKLIKHLWRAWVGQETGED